MNDLQYQRMYVPSHPHARSQESKIFGRVFLPLNASGRIFRRGSGGDRPWPHRSGDRAGDAGGAEPLCRPGHRSRPRTFSYEGFL